MIFSDLVALAKAGYKPADVKEILSMDAKKPAGNEEPAEIPAGASGQPEPEKEAAAAPANPSQEIEQNKTLAEQVEDLKKQLAKTQEDLAKAQQANTRTDSSEGAKKPTTDEQLQDLIRSYM